MDCEWLGATIERRLRAQWMDGWIKPKGDGTRPLDKILEDMHKDHSVVYYMLPTVEPQKAAPKAKPDKPEKQNWGAPWKGNESSSWRSPKTGAMEAEEGSHRPEWRQAPIAAEGVRKYHTRWKSHLFWLQHRRLQQGRPW